VNFASIVGDETDGLDGRTSIHVGAVAEFAISEKFSIQPELVYSSQGSTLDFSEEFEGFRFSEEITTKLDYLNIHILAKLYLTEGLSVEAGPQIGFLLSAKNDFEFTDGDDSESGTNDIDDFVNNVDFALGLGVGYKLQNGLNFAVRYNLGLSNIVENDNFDETQRNGVFQVSIGYLFFK
jgi:hypothetical protein